MRVECSYTEMVNPNDLTDHNRNNNKHNDKQIERLAKLIDHHGWRLPIVVSKLSNKIVFGHARKQAAILNGWDSVPVDYQDFEDEKAEYLALTADNEIARWAELDFNSLIEDIKELEIEDFDLLGIADFSLFTEVADLDDINNSTEEDSKFILQVTLKNDMDFNDLKDDLLSKGYIVKEM